MKESELSSEEQQLARYLPIQISEGSCCFSYKVLLDYYCYLVFVSGLETLSSKTASYKKNEQLNREGEKEDITLNGDKKNVFAEIPINADVLELWALQTKEEKEICTKMLQKVQEYVGQHKEEDEAFAIAI